MRYWFLLPQTHKSKCIPLLTWYTHVYVNTSNSFKYTTVSISQNISTCTCKGKHQYGCPFQYFRQVKSINYDFRRPCERTVDIPLHYCVLFQGRLVHTTCQLERENKTAFKSLLWFSFYWPASFEFTYINAYLCFTLAFWKKYSKRVAKWQKHIMYIKSLNRHHSLLLDEGKYISLRSLW